ncbi:MAG: hypothetical protein ACJ71D_04255 [Nitrososphaera sp.]
MERFVTFPMPVIIRMKEKCAKNATNISIGLSITIMIITTSVQVNSEE